MMGMGYLRLNKVLAKHKWTPNTQTGSDIIERNTDADDWLLRLIVFGALCLPIVALIASDLLLDDPIRYYWILFSVLIGCPLALVFIWTMLYHDPMILRGVIVAATLIGGLVAIVGSIYASPRLQLFLQAVAMYLFVVAIFAVAQAWFLIRTSITAQPKELGTD